MRAAALKPALLVTAEAGKAGKGAPVPPAPARFRKGGVYQFRSANYRDATIFSKIGMGSVRFRFMREEPGNRVTLFMFESVRGGWRESFTPFQLEGHEIKEAK